MGLDSACSVVVTWLPIRWALTSFNMGDWDNVLSAFQQMDDLPLNKRSAACNKTFSANERKWI